MRYGARVEKHGSNISEAKSYAMKLARKEELLYVNG
jgi:threonine dehydratase